MAPPYQRIAILGSSGGGKSWLAREIGRRTGLPVIHLDAHFWRPGWVEPDPETWRRQVAELAAGERWVMDGNYSATWDIRLSRAQALVYLDVSRWLCRWRVVTRTLTQYGRTRVDLAPGCPEHFDWEFLRYVWNHPKRRPGHMAKLAAYAPGRDVFELSSRRAVGRFLDSF